MENKDQLEKLALDVRKAIEEHIREHDTYLCSDILNPIQTFPNGCCKNVSIILGLIMERNLKLDNVKMIQGIARTNENELSDTHIWIEYNSYIIDLTIDQFDSFDAPLVIHVKESAFHKQEFPNQNKFSIDLSKDHPLWQVYLDIGLSILTNN